MRMTEGLGSGLEGRTTTTDPVEARRAAFPFRAPLFFLFDVPDALLDQGSPSSLKSAASSVSASVVAASAWSESRRPKAGGERGRRAGWERIAGGEVLSKSESESGESGREEVRTGVVGAVVGAEVVRAETREGGLVRISELNESPNEARGRTGDLAKRVEEVVLKGSIFFFSTWKAVRTGGFLPPPPPPPVGSAIFLFPPSIEPSPPTHFPNSPAVTLVSGSHARTFSAR